MLCPNLYDIANLVILLYLNCYLRQYIGSFTGSLSVLHEILMLL